MALKSNDQKFKYYHMKFQFEYDTFEEKMIDYEKNSYSHSIFSCTSKILKGELKS